MRGLLGAFLIASTATAAAQPRDEDKAEADHLFYEGRQLLAQDKRVEACAKFDLSFRKDPRAVGTILNLALCGEMSGAVATAVRYYAEARDRARDQSLAEYQEAAERKITLLAPRVPHLKIVLTEALPGTRVLVDNAVLAPDQLADVLVDPGVRTLIVTAPGRLPYETRIDIKEGDTRTATVPRLEGARTVIVRSSNRRSYGKIAVGVGAGVVAGGIVLGAWGRGRYWEQFPDASRDGEIAMDRQHNCWTQLVGSEVARRCNASGESEIKTSLTIAHSGTGVAIAGGVIAAIGMYMWVTGPKADGMTIVPTASADRVGVELLLRY